MNTKKITGYVVNTLTGAVTVIAGMLIYDKLVKPMLTKNAPVMPEDSE